MGNFSNKYDNYLKAFKCGEQWSNESSNSTRRIDERLQRLNSHPLQQQVSDLTQLELSDAKTA